MSVEFRYNLAVSVMSLLVALFALLLAFRKTKKEDEITRKVDLEKNTLYAPLLQVTNYKVTLPEKYSLRKDQAIRPSFNCFSADRRTLTNSQGREVTMYSVYVNAASKDTDLPEDDIGFARFTFKNTGHPCLAFEIASIVFTLKNGETISVKPTEVGGPVRNSLPLFEEEIEIMLSICSASTGKNQVFDLSKSDPRCAEADNVLYTYMPSLEKTELWRSICLTLYVMNNQATIYQQEICLVVEDCIISSSSKLLD